MCNFKVLGPKWRYGKRIRTRGLLFILLSDVKVVLWDGRVKVVLPTNPGNGSTKIYLFHRHHLYILTCKSPPIVYQLYRPFAQVFLLCSHLCAHWVPHQLTCVTSALLSHTLAETEKIYACMRRPDLAAKVAGERSPVRPGLRMSERWTRRAHDPRVYVDVSAVAWAFGLWAHLSCWRASFWGGGPWSITVHGCYVLLWSCAFRTGAWQVSSVDDAWVLTCYCRSIRCALTVILDLSRTHSCLRCCFHNVISWMRAP
jgi:hypothetical protein